jgi:glyceraldehyde-3-phosphate dehydrogenase (NADP+)
MSAAHKLYIGGEWVATGQTEPVTEAFSGKSLGEVCVAGEAELEQAITAAQKGFTAFRKSPRAERHRLLREIYRRVADAKNELAELIARDAGKPIVQARGEVDRALITFELAAQEAFRFGGEVMPIDIQARTAGYTCQVERFPIGPVAGITPFNFPLNLLAHKLAPVIAVGSAIVVKIPPQAPLAALRLAALCHDAGLPQGVYNALHLPVALAEKMVRDERLKVLSFTGSAAVGWHLKSVAGKKRVLLELGGNAGVLVHDDADIDKAVDKIVFGSFAYAGQVCIKVQRVFAHRPIYDKFVARLVEKAKTAKAGDPLFEDTLAGPVIDRKSFDRILAWVEEARQAGAKILCGGTGVYPVVQPTVIESADRALNVSCSEVFGPVTVVAPYENWDHGLALVNDGPYGLQAGVFTHDLRRVRQAYEVLEVGGVVVNDVPTIRADNYPYGGVKDSGLGREGVRYAMEEMSELRALITNYN